MKVHSLTEEEREKMVDLYLSKMNITRKRLTKEELEKEIIDYLEKETSLLTGNLWKRWKAPNFRS